MQSADFVKVLTIKQPFAGLLLRGIKKFELRNWETSYRGLVYLHASASPHPLLKEAQKQYPDVEYPLGVLLGCGSLSAIHSVTMVTDQLLDLDQQAGSFRCAWQFTELHALPPLPLKGKLGLWTWGLPQEAVDAHP